MTEKYYNQQKPPLVYSCSGCSNLAQMANQIAIDFDREGVAEMSCIAGLGGDVKPLVRKAIKAASIIALDGCHLQCVKNTLARHHLVANWHFTLTDEGLKKRYHVDFLPTDLKTVKQKIKQTIESASNNG